MTRINRLRYRSWNRMAMNVRAFVSAHDRLPRSVNPDFIGELELGVWLDKQRLRGAWRTIDSNRPGRHLFYRRWRMLPVLDLLVPGWEQAAGGGPRPEEAFQYKSSPLDAADALI